MIICICSEYKTSDLVEDVENNKKLKDIVKEKEICNNCKKCCKFLKEEYERISSF